MPRSLKIPIPERGCAVGSFSPNDDELPSSWLVPVHAHQGRDSAGPPAPQPPHDIAQVLRENEFWSKPAPEGESGRDQSGLAQVDVSRSRRPLRLVLQNHWRTKLTPEGLGSAVLQAYQDAIRRQFEAAMRQPRIAAAEPDEEPVFDTNVLTPYLHGSVRASRNYLSDIADAVHRYHEADWELWRREPPPAPRAKGPSGAKVRLQFADSRLTACEIDSNWAAERTAAQIMNEFSQTLEYLRDPDGARVAADPTGPQAQRKAALDDLQELAYEGVAALRAMLND